MAFIPFLNLPDALGQRVKRGTIDIGAFEFGISPETEFDIPESFKLYPNYPNPFNPATKIRYDLKESANVTLKIYNILGQEIRTLINSRKTIGYHVIEWDGRDNFGNKVVSGFYIFRIWVVAPGDNGNFSASRKMVLIQ